MSNGKMSTYILVIGGEVWGGGSVDVLVWFLLESRNWRDG